MSGGRRGGKGVSRGKKLFLMSLMTFIALAAVTQFSSHADPGGTKTGSILANSPLAFGTNAKGVPVAQVPVSQAGLNTLATQTGHLGISLNLTWLFITRFLLLFIQVRFALLVTCV